MKKIVKVLMAWFFRIAFWFRYRVTVKGLDKLTKAQLNKPGGVLFLPNHPAVFVDPTMVTLALWPKFIIRPMVVEYMYYHPLVNPIMRYLDALPIPDFVVSSNSLKRRKSEKMVDVMIDGLKKGENFLIYPAGKTKSTGYEAIGGASAAHRIIQSAPEANIVLVRTKGLWGSSFSRYATGLPPPLVPTIWENMKHVFKNLLFFTPRRKVTIEFEAAPPDFPFNGTRLEINRYLEKWYNTPDGLSAQEGKYPGDSAVLKSLSIWGNVVPKQELSKAIDKSVDLNKVPADVRACVMEKLAELTESSPERIKPEMSLAVDLGLDSLDIADVAIFLQDEFEVGTIPFTELRTVSTLLGIASKQITFEEEGADAEADVSKWKAPKEPRKRVKVYPGATIPEVFLNACDALKNNVSSGDARSGILTYRQLKMRALLLADFIKDMPGDYIGIMLPASVGAQVIIMAVLLAGKVPLMVNWTVGPRHLESVLAVSKVKVILSSWAFIDRLENVELTPIEDQLILLEDFRHKIKLKHKLKALFRSFKKAPALMKNFNLTRLKADDQAVLLFTSGSEAMPKGVPLTHNNILSNIRAALNGIEIYNDDVLLGMLPPFHAFGFTVTTILPTVVGIRVAFSPNPTDGTRLAKDIPHWQATIMGGTPTFIKGVMRKATPEHFSTVRFAFTGAERAPPDLFRLMEQFGKSDFLLEGYGITECSPILTFNRMGEPRRGVGKPSENVELLVVQPETNEPLPVGEQGMILVRGPNIFKGYINPGLASPFVEAAGKTWYKTGDLGYLDKEGYLTISGRLKRFIKIGAEMVSLTAIEEALFEEGHKRHWFHEPLPEGPVVAICAKEADGEKPRIYLFSTYNLPLEEVNRALRDAGFPNLVRVTSVQHVMTIPVMGSGKTNYRILETEYLPKMETKQNNDNRDTEKPG